MLYACWPLGSYSFLLRALYYSAQVASDAERHLVFEEITAAGSPASGDGTSTILLSLMTDVFGNYVVQKLFDHGAAERSKSRPAE